MRTKLYGVLASLALCILYPAAASRALGEDALAQAMSSSKILVDSSLRTEDVQQNGFASDAHAMTWRNRLGIQTGEFEHVSALVEIENVYVLDGDYNSSVNGKTQYPTVSDPNVTEWHRAELIWAPSAGTTLTVGRQRIILDDARFVGNSGWRQDDQVYDGARFDGSTGKFHFVSVYISHVNRVVGDYKDWNSNSYLLNGIYEFGPQLKLSAFDYALRFTSDATAATSTDRANARNSSVTIKGLRGSGGRKFEANSFGYVLQIATESNAEGNPQSFQLQETMVEVNDTYKWLSGRVNYESLGGNGHVGFVTPLASNHSFEGYADAFSATGGNKTFINGIDDLNYTLTATAPTKFTPAFSVIYHDFSTARLDERLGRELDLVATAALTRRLNLMVKTADYHSENASGPVSRTKEWIMLTYKR